MQSCNVTFQPLEVTRLQRGHSRLTLSVSLYGAQVLESWCQLARVTRAASDSVPPLASLSSPQVLFINGRDVSTYTHREVVRYIKSCRETQCDLELTVKPNRKYHPETRPFSSMPSVLL